MQPHNGPTSKHIIVIPTKPNVTALVLIKINKTLKRTPIYMCTSINT